MLIGSIDCGTRVANNVTDIKKPWYSAGVSMAATVTVINFGHSDQDIPVEVLVSESTKNSLKTYLLTTIGPYNLVSITPDSQGTGDDLQIGATPGSPVNVTFIDFQATFTAYNLWTCNILLRKYV